MRIRDGEAGDIDTIAELIRETFASAEHSSGTEAALVSGLREAGALTVSLVGVQDEAIVGHVAVSPVSIAGAAGWFGLGPVSVQPACQGRGIGGALIQAALDRLKRQAAAGCVVLGGSGLLWPLRLRPQTRPQLSRHPAAIPAGDIVRTRRARRRSQLSRGIQHRLSGRYPEG